MNRSSKGLIVGCLVSTFPAATAVGDQAYSAEAGIYKFREDSSQSFWRVQNIKSTGQPFTTARATWSLAGSPWGNAASGDAIAIGYDGGVSVQSSAATNALSGGSVSVAGALTDDLIISRRDGMPASGTVAGTVRLTLRFDVSIGVANLYEGNREFNGARLDWQFAVLDVFETPFSGWITRTPDGTFSSGSQSVGSQTFEVPFGASVGTPVGLRMSAALGAQVLGNSDQTASVNVSSAAVFELGESSEKSANAPRLAIILPPEYRADSVKWNIVDGYYTPPPATPCPADLDGSRVVDPADIALLLLDFGACPGCASDLDGSGETDSADVGLMLLEFGDCPSEVP